MKDSGKKTVKIRAKPLSTQGYKIRANHYQPINKGVNKSLIAIVLLIIVGIVILSYMDTTGSATKVKSYSSITIQLRDKYDREINAGDYIKVIFKPGCERGYDPYYDIYKVESKVGYENVGQTKDVRVIGRKRLSMCPLPCTKEYVENFKVGSGWKGTYYFKVLDNCRIIDSKTGEDKYIKGYFEVK